MKKFSELKVKDLLWIVPTGYGPTTAHYRLATTNEPIFIEKRDFTLVQVVYIELYAFSMRIAVRNEAFQHTIYIANKDSSFTRFYDKNVKNKDWDKEEKQLITELY